DDVGVIEAREQARLAQQLAEVDALFVRDLERDLLVDPRVVREVDRPEAAAADRREDLVFPDDLSAKKHPGASITFARAPILRAGPRRRRRDRDAAARRSGTSAPRAAARRRRPGRRVRRTRTRVPRARR